MIHSGHPKETCAQWVAPWDTINLMPVHSHSLNLLLHLPFCLNLNAG